MRPIIQTIHIQGYSKQLKRCRIMGLVLLGVAAVPLAINLLAGLTFQTYWKYIAVLILSFLYLLAALIKRSEKKPEPIAQAVPIASAAPAAPSIAPAESKPQADATKME